MTTKFIGVKEFRQNMSRYTKDAQDNNERLILVRKNKPIFKLVPLSEDEVDLESLLLSAEQAKEDVRKGEAVTLSEMKKQLKL